MKSETLRLPEGCVFLDGGGIECGLPPDAIRLSPGTSWESAWDGRRVVCEAVVPQMPEPPLLARDSGGVLALFVLLLVSAVAGFAIGRSKR